MMPPRSRRVGEHVRRRMKPALLRSRHRRSAHPHARSQVTRAAERLRPVTRVAPRTVLPRRHRMHRQPVVRMNLPRSHATVVAPRTVVFPMAARAQPAVVPCHTGMPLDEVRIVLRVVEPSRGSQHAPGQMRLHPAANARQVTDRALRSRLAPRLRRQIVAPQAPAHSRHVRVRRKPRLLHRAVALPAADVATRVRPMIRVQRCFGHRHPLHHLRLRRVPPLVARSARPERRGSSRHRPELRMLRAMAAIAHHGRGHQTVRGHGARRGRRMTVQARQLHARVLRVVKTQGDGLRREDDRTGMRRLRGSRRKRRDRQRAGNRGRSRCDQRDRKHDPRNPGRAARHRVTTI